MLIVIVVWIVVFVMSIYGYGSPITGSSVKSKISLGNIFSTLLYLGVIVAIILAILYYVPALTEREKSLSNKLYVYSQSGSGIAGGYTENSMRLVSGKGSGGTTFVLHTTESIEGDPEFDAWINGTNGSTIVVRMLDIYKTGQNAVFKKVKISPIQTGYGAIFKTGRMTAYVADGKTKARVEDAMIDYHSDKRKYDIEVEVYIPDGGIVDFEKVQILNQW